MIYGKLTGLHLGDLLQWLQTGGLSGRLTFDGRWSRHLDFLDGRVVYVASDCPEERLASWLVRSGRLPASTVRKILGHSLLEKRLFTELLLKKKKTSRAKLKAAVSELAEIITRGILGEDELEFRFDPEYATRDLLNLNLNMDPNSLLLEAARKLDEHEPASGGQVSSNLPFEGMEFEEFFLDLVERGVGDEAPLDGPSYLQSRNIIRGVMQTLGRWLRRGPGLVPMPSGGKRNTQEKENGKIEVLRTSPQLSWNLLVLASLVSSRELEPISGLENLSEVIQEMGILPALYKAEGWTRPEAVRLDHLSSDTALNWGRAAAAAAETLRISPDLAFLAVHIVIVPTDLVLWVLSTIGIPHHGLRQALLEELPIRVGRVLSSRACFPTDLQLLFQRENSTPLGICLGLSSRILGQHTIWPSLLAHFSHEELAAAARTIEEMRELGD